MLLLSLRQDKPAAEARKRMDGDDTPADRTGAGRNDDRPLLFLLWHLLKATRDTADASYASVTSLPSMHRQILIILFRGWGQTFPALCTLIGKDKAQVSRAVARLEETGHVSRARARGPLALTPEGDAVARRLVVIAHIRNDRLLAGLDAATVADLHAVTELLIQRAKLLYEAERALGEDAADMAGWDDGDPAAMPRPPGDTVLVQRLIALLAYAQRSMALAAKRLVAMPAFDTLVLALIVDHRPLPQARLVVMLGRDQSQAARTIRRLIADGLIVRTPESTRRSILLAPTAEGLRINGVMALEVARRDAFMGQAITPDRLAAYRRTLAIVATNAAAPGTPVAPPTNDPGA